jgi:hypothetical protein
MLQAADGAALDRNDITSLQYHRLNGLLLSGPSPTASFEKTTTTAKTVLQITSLRSGVPH